MRKAGGLRDKNEGDAWRKVFINPDMTKKEQEDAYKLRQEKKRRTEAGERDLVIYKGEIVVRSTITAEPSTQPQQRSDSVNTRGRTSERGNSQRGGRGGSSRRGRPAGDRGGRGGHPSHSS